jgi:aryl-alcohol dehydrogenase-like predicted oxidoreductase
MEALWTSDKRGLARFDSYQPEYSLVERQGFEVEAMKVCRHYGIGVIPYSPLAAGFLTGKYRKGGERPDSVRAGGVLDKYGNDKGYAAIDALDEIGRAQQNGRSDRACVAPRQPGHDRPDHRRE